MLAGAAVAQTYRWIDENGRVRYSDTPPPAAAKGVERKSYSTGTTEPTIPYQTQRAMRDAPVVLYTAPECAKVCADGRALLEKRGIPYRESIVRGNDAIEELKLVSGGKNQVPTLVVGKEPVSGFEATLWNAALDKAGYPAAGVYKPSPTVTASMLPPVKLYTNSECKDLCEQARSFLAARKVRFQEVPVEDEASFAELQKVSGGMSVPVLLVGKHVQKGYDPGIYERVLDAAGFPKTAAK